MKIAYLGATGKVGTHALRELSARGHAITAITTHPDAVEALTGVTVRAGDANDPAGLAPLLAGHDVIVSSIQFAKIDYAKLIAAVRASSVARYFVVGGSGTLLAPGTTTRIMDGPNFPPALLGNARAAAGFFDRLRAEKDLDWTYFSPPPMLGGGGRTGVFRIGGDELLVGPDGKATISYEDYAIALADELENPRYRGGKRFTAGY
ncbi:MAG: NAD(P)-dependent oxidoreductase [Hyphomonadaceae bacterium]